MSVAAPQVSNDLMDLDNLVGPREFALFDELRENDPVHWNAPSEHGPGFWALLRHQDVKDAAADPRLSSAAGTQIVDRKVEGHGRSSLHNMDDPEHSKLRLITVPHLRAVKIQHWNEVIQDAVTHLLDEAARQDGVFDLVDVVSARLPMLVLARVLGVPREDAPKMVDWTNRLTSADPETKVDEAALAQARDEVMDYFKSLTEARRKQPTEDLVSVLANAQKDGVPLTWDELAAYYIVLVAAGNETVRQLISGATIAMDRVPDRWQWLREQPERLGPAIEEFLRYVTPIASMRRTATEDLVMGGQRIAAGDKVVMWFSAANRDPSVFTNPHQMILDRKPNDHITFGWGVHFCLGSHLARAEVRAFFTEMLRRGQHFQVAGEPHRVRHQMFRGWSQLPVRLVTP